jgi:hypothetical protein
VPAVRTDSSFTVTARVRFAPGAVVPPAATAVSQGGPLSSGFALEWVRSSGTQGFWRFSVSPADGANPAYVRARSAGSAVVGTWTHLAGVYDAAAGEVRLYVDGLRVAATAGRVSANVAGNILIGYAVGGSGGTTNFWSGAIDDVHVWTGVRTADEIRDDESTPVTGRETAFAGQLGRFVRNGDDAAVSTAPADRFTTTGPVPPGYHFSAPLGIPAPQGASDTRPAYSCLRGSDEFTSVQADCKGDRVLRVLGPLYIGRPDNVPTLPIYLCRAGSDLFDSNDAGCEGAAYESRLGYAQAYAHLVRSKTLGVPADRTTSTARVPGHEPEVGFGIVALTQVTGTTALYRCENGADQFTTTDSGCEGIGQRPQRVGWIWTAAPPNAQESVELFRCTDGSDRFDTTDRACWGRTFERSLGFVVRQF